MLTITGDERHWDTFAKGIGRADLTTDPRFAETSQRRTNARLLTKILDEVFAAKDWADWYPILEKTGVAFGVVATLTDIPHDEQMRASGRWCRSRTRVRAPPTPCRARSRSRQEKVPATLAPEIGEHTIEVLKGAGVPDAEIERLLRAGSSSRRRNVMADPALMDRMFTRIMRGLVDSGTAPHYAELARALGLSVEDGRRLLHDVMQAVPDRLAASGDGLHRVVPAPQQPAHAVSRHRAGRAAMVRAMRVRGRPPSRGSSRARPSASTRRVSTVAIPSRSRCATARSPGSIRRESSAT
jgi:hypothetical protein